MSEKSGASGYRIWRRPHGSGGWIRTAHHVMARSDKEAQGKVRRMFADAGFHNMALVAVPFGASPSAVSEVSK